jgi:DNA-binding XRE family transcriptional regulator
MAVVLDRSQRDAVYRLVVRDLPDVGEIARALEAGNVAVAQRLRRRFDEDVLLLDLLDWGECGGRESYEIPLPAVQAEAIFARLYAGIMGEIEVAVSGLLDRPVGRAIEAASICIGVVRRLRAEGAAGSVRGAASSGMRLVMATPKHSPAHQALGRAVRWSRARQGLSQEELAHQCGLHRNYVGAVERGEINATFRVLRKLAGGLRMPLSKLIAEGEAIEHETRAG